ncbi:peptidoglycan/LPS O-acetylase OafA/YrhL [Homoserinimonas aerilata]|uniref:Peptidoglycan/LPS O-acetylase OafA/YrhL n=1 Tax=Homoserinimonas aerilata TaxID=1162970 RepID=A0A542YLD0_9MICO|nr:acyltransferase family protein [Homoserinimonas aerilata]TQL48905.1 peptidoglycan/LPS O-acetylase OafA/YrhL [Homoserinimonas aerilata]
MKTSPTPADTSAPPQPSAPARFAGLDGLRAIAVLLVIAYHLFPGTLDGGFIGVDVFFVISGFLITALLLREHTDAGRIRLGRFWLRRARRLLPALGLLVLACATAAWTIGGDVIVGLGRQVLGAATFSSNWLSLAASQSYFDQATPELFRNLWSLAVEEQFYLLWPLLLLALLLIRAPWVRITVMIAAAAASAVGMALLLSPLGDPTRVYYGTDTHSFGLMLGAALALLVARAPVSAPWLRRVLAGAGAVSLVGIIAAGVMLSADAATTYRGGLVIVALLSVLVVLGATHGSPSDGTGAGAWFGRALDVQPLRWIGERSYGLYLWHWPVHVLLLAALPHEAAITAPSWLLGTIALVITVAASAASHRFVEQPVRRLGFRGALRAGWRRAFPGWLTGPAGHPKSSTGRRGLRAVAGIAAVALLVGAGAATTAGIIADPGAGTVQTQIEAGQKAIAESATPAPSAPPADGQASDTPSAHEEPVTLPAGDQITAIGDSVMLASARSLQEEFPGIDIDATVSRQFSSAPELIRTRLEAGTLRPTVLLGLGTNGPIDREALAEVRKELGTEHQLVLVNVFAARSWTDGVNTALTSFAQQYRDVELANWRDSIAPQTSLLARDNIHPGDAGGRVYAAAVRDALQRLAELPPLLGPRDFGLAARPV